MWAVFLLIALVIAFVIIALVLLFSSLEKKDRNDFKDGGGKQVGGNEKVPFFAPQNERTGLIGENIVVHHLRLLLRNGEYLLANVLLPVNEKFKTEIDCILISRKGIFCIEIKNWVGHIHGNDEDENWLQVYDDPDLDDRRHKNPVKQNLSHCNILNRNLNGKYMIDNIVIITGSDDIEHVHSKYAFSLFGFKNFYRAQTEDELTLEDIERIYNKLCRYVATKEQREEHKKNIQKRYLN